MRFLHTADWHIGKQLRDRRRDDEYELALAELIDIAQGRQVDCVLVAGDIFESTAPSPESERIAFNFFRELSSAGIPAIAIAGNHDNSKRLNAFGRILDLVDIRVVGDPLGVNEGGVIEIPSRDRSEVAQVAVLPWVHERKARTWQSLTHGDRHYEEYADAVGELIDHLYSRFAADRINILLAHVMVDGAIVGGEGSGERALHVGHTYAIRPRLLRHKNAQYVALGHLHRPQPIVDSYAYYSGSLLQLDFGEAGQEKSVSVVEVAAGLPAKVEHVPLTSIKQLRNLGSHKEGVTLDEIKAVAPEIADDYVKVFLKVDAPVPGLAEQVRELLPNAVDIVPDYGEREETASDVDISRESPPELFGAYYRGAHAGEEPPKELMGLFNRLYEEASAAPD